MRIEYGFDPVLGWRIWRIRDGMLRGIALETTWLPQFRFEANCDATLSHHRESRVDGTGHAAPERTCGCGVSAFKTYEDAIQLSREQFDYDVIAVGRVSLWGRVIETERGFRGERAYPYDLELLGGTKELAIELRNRYAVDVAVGPTPVPLHAA